MRAEPPEAGRSASGGRITGSGPGANGRPVQEMPGTDLTSRSPNRGTGSINGLGRTGQVTPGPLQEKTSGGNMATLFPGQSLLPGQSLQSDNRLYTLTMQPDGNVVLRDSESKPLWRTGTGGGQIDPRDFIMQTDGNLVLYDTSGQQHWASKTQGNPGAFLNVQDDGNVVVYRGGFYHSDRGQCAMGIAQAFLRRLLSRPSSTAVQCSTSATQTCPTSPTTCSSARTRTGRPLGVLHRAGLLVGRSAQACGAAPHP